MELAIFSTMNTVYRVIAVGFGLLWVERAPREGRPDAFEGYSFSEGFYADAVFACPTEEGGHVLEDRRVAFHKDGRVIASTSHADRRAYMDLPWGTYEQGLVRRYASIGV